MQRLLLALIAPVVLVMPAVAHADSVCVAADSVPITNPGTKAAVGTLEKRTCVGILERLDDRMRVWVTNSTFQGESLLDNSAVLNLLVDDVDVLRKAGGESHGTVLSGTPVLVTEHNGETVRVRTVEGRVALEFVTESDAVFPSGQWPAPDIDEEPPDDWPVAERVVPPKGGRITADSAGFEPIATVTPQVYGVEEILRDPALGNIGFRMVEQTELDAKVQLITPTMWVEGYAGALEWREEPPVTGWNQVEGVKPLVPWIPAPREVGTKDVPISTEAKGEAFGKLMAGARVSVGADEKGWLPVTAAWPGGSVSGWIQKKYLVKEGKETVVSPTPRPIAAVAIWQMARQWADVTGHDEENDEGVMETVESELDLDSVRRQITDQFGGLRVLYAQLLKRKPESAGTLTGRVVVDPEGTIVKAHLPEGSLREVELQQRLVAMLEGLQFEEREVPKKKRKRKKKGEEEEPETNWNVQVWIQFNFKNVAQ
jgi:hypothetical protein